MPKANSNGKGHEPNGAPGGAGLCPECRQPLTGGPGRGGRAAACSRCGPAVRRPSARVQIF